MFKRYLIYITGILLSLAFSNLSFAWAKFSYKDGKWEFVVTEKGQDPLSRELLEASYKGDISAVERALNQGANVNVQNYMGDTGLMLATKKEHLDIVKLFLDKKAYVNVRSFGGGTALVYAVVNQNKEIIELLLDARADVNVKINRTNDEYYQKTPLFYAIATGDKEITELLLGAGADMEVRFFGNTPLEMALKDRKIEIAQLIEVKKEENKMKRMGPDYMFNYP